MKKLLTETDIIKLVKEGSKEIVVDEQTVLTPLAMDKVRRLKIPVVKKSSAENDSSKKIKSYGFESKKVAIGSDHTGLKLKSILSKYLSENSFEVIDVGTNTEESCDYPDFAFLVAKMVALKEVEFGIMVDATGIPSAITANKIPGIRAATCYNEFTSKSAREHNNANVLVLGAKAIGEETAKSIIDVWLKTGFAGERHQRRLDKISDIEKTFFNKNNLTK